MQQIQRHTLIGRRSFMAKPIAIITLGGLLLCGLSRAQNPPSASDQPTVSPASSPQTQPQPPAPPSPTPGTAANSTPPGPTRIAPGNVIPVQLIKTVDAKKAKTGDQVMAKVTMDLKNNSGEVIVPKDTAVIGHVTEVQPRNKEQKQSELGIAFDQARMKTGDLQMPMSIQAIIAPPSMNSNDSGGAPAQTSDGASPSAMGGGRMGPGGTAPAQQPQTATTPALTTGPVGGTGSESQTGDRPTITGNTQGVIGIPDLKLETSGQNPSQGSMMSSEKNNVKLESGTLMLLRVSPTIPSAASQSGANQ
jgi:hypothetical protein